MIHLKEIDFKNLLSDIYTAFAPQKLSGVPKLVEDYKETDITQRSAVQMAFIKYVNISNSNYAKYSHILPEVGTEKNIMFLMEAYSRGERMISEDAVSEIQRQLKDQEQERLLKEVNDKAKKEEEASRKLAEAEEDRLRRISEAQQSSEKSNETLVGELQKAKSELQEFKEQTIKEVQDYKKELSEQEPKQVSAFEDMELEIIGFEEPVSKDEDGATVYQNADINSINLPPKKYIATFCIGQRFMIKDTNDSIVGIEVSNITDDYITDPEKPIRMINLRKV